MVSSVRHRPEGVRCERTLPGISFLYKWLCRLAGSHGSIGSGWRNMPQTSLLPAMPPPGDGLEARRSWVKRRELFGPDVIEPRAQVLPDAAIRIALDLQQPGRIYC
jgi:hypothetical protein